MIERDFSFRPVLEGLTAEINERELAPLEGFIRLEEEIARVGLEPRDYGSTSITSGGHAYVPGLEMGEVIARNTETCRMLASELVGSGQIDAGKIILPVDVGKVSHWGQSDFIEFWYAVIARPQFSGFDRDHSLEAFRRTLDQSIEEFGVDLDLFNSKQDASVRAAEYFRHGDAFIAGLEGYERTPLERVIRMVDPDTSLGGQAERALARKLDIPVFDIVATGVGSSVDAAIGNPQLRHDREQIVQFGGTLVHLATKEILVLTPEEQDSQV